MFLTLGSEVCNFHSYDEYNGFRVPTKNWLKIEINHYFLKAQVTKNF